MEKRVGKMEDIFLDLSTNTMTKHTRTFTTMGDNKCSRENDNYLTERDILVYQVQLCERANRFDEMAVLMKDMCRNYDNLTVEERNLLSCAYKNVIGSRRTSCRVLNETFEATTSSSSTNNEGGDEKSSKFNPVLIKSILSDIKAELKNHCNDILSILSDRLIPSVSTTGESKVFYYKMKGDYTRYLCETCTGPERKEKANESLLAYKTASDKAMIELPPTHPVRLGLMLNFSVFYHEIMKSPERSCRLAKQAFDDAIAELDTLSEESYRDSTIIMQLLRDNLNLWQSEQILQPINDLVVQPNPSIQFKQLQQATQPQQ